MFAYSSQLTFKTNAEVIPLSFDVRLSCFKIFYPVLMNGLYIQRNRTVMPLDLPHVKSEFKEVLDSGFHALDSGFQILNFCLCQWNLDSGI